MRFQENLKQVLAVDDSPHRIGVAFALGAFIAMSALIGLHTILGFALSHVFKLSKRVTIAGVFINNPWTTIPIYSFCLWIGLVLAGSEAPPPDIDWSNLSFSMLTDDLIYYLVPFVVGTTVVGLVSAVAGYFLIKHAVIKYRS